MEVIEPIETMRNICRRLARRGNNTIRFVPTMGSLHAGHGSLINRAKYDIDDHNEEVTVNSTTTTTTTTGEVDKQTHTSADGGCHESNGGRASCSGTVVIVSIFINPTQFNNREDFLKYPQTLERDLELCRRLNVDYVFVPKADDIYGASTTTTTTTNTCSIRPPQRLANDLEGKSRPGHFEGVLTIVCKLFNIISPKRAYFGEKDYQQLVLIKQMVRALNMDVEICPVETSREPDHLPLSSRNIRLNETHRRRAVIMYDILMEAKRTLEQKCRLKFGVAPMDDALCDLQIIILSSMLATQCLSTIEPSPSEEVGGDHDQYDVKETSTSSINVDYLELRCSKDLSPIGYDQALGAYDCRDGCVLRQSSNRSSEKGYLILKARLLIAVVVGGVRLLDNVEVQLNLS